MKIFFQVPAPLGISPGQRFRFEHYLPFLKENALEYKVSSFYSFAGWQILYSKGRVARKALIVLLGFFERLADIFRMLPFDYVYIYREATPIGPPVFEWITV